MSGAREVADLGEGVAFVVLWRAKLVFLCVRAMTLLVRVSGRQRAMHLLRVSAGR